MLKRQLVECSIPVYLIHYKQFVLCGEISRLLHNKSEFVGKYFRLLLFNSKNYCITACYSFQSLQTIIEMRINLKTETLLLHDRDAPETLWAKAKTQDAPTPRPRLNQDVPECMLLPALTSSETVLASILFILISSSRSFSVISQIVFIIRLYMYFSPFYLVLQFCKVV